MRTLLIPSIVYNVQRAIAAGLTLAALLLLSVAFGGTNLPVGDEASLGGATATVLGISAAPLGLMPLGIAMHWVLRKFGKDLQNGGVIGSATLFAVGLYFWCSLIGLMIGDPAMLLLKRIAPDVVPVDKPKLWNPYLLIQVEGDADEYKQMKIDRRAYREAERSARSARSSQPQQPAQVSAVLQQVQASDAEREVLQGIVDLCHSSPREAIARLDALAGHLRSQQVMMLARFHALRALAFENAGRRVETTTLRGLETEPLRRLIGADHITFAVQALEQVAAIERQHPGSMAALSEEDGDTYGLTVWESVALVAERLKPGEMQRTLSHTALMWFGPDRIGFAPGVLESMPDDLLERIIGVAIGGEPPILSVVGNLWRAADNGARVVEFDAYATPAMGEDGALSLGTLGLYDDLRVAFVARSNTGQASVNRAPQAFPTPAAQPRSEAAPTSIEPPVAPKRRSGNALLGVFAMVVVLGFGAIAYLFFDGGSLPFGLAQPAHIASSDLPIVDGAMPIPAPTTPTDPAAVLPPTDPVAVPTEPVAAPPPTDPAAPAPPQGANGNLVAKASGLRYRAAPSAAADVAILAETTAGGEPLTITGRMMQPDGEWYQVALADGRVAYFKASLAVEQSQLAASLSRDTSNDALRPFASISPLVLGPAEGAVFDHYPRRTVLSWAPIPGADRYIVEVEMYDSGRRRWVEDSSSVRRETVYDDSYTFNFVGAQPGRFRVRGVSATGEESANSRWSAFRYTR